MLLENKVIVITGTASGIGLSTAEKCLAEGATVIANYRSKVAGIASLIDKYGGDRVIAVKADVANAAEVSRMMELAKHRCHRIDGLVCNAGVITRTPDWKDIPLEDWECVLMTNLIGTWNVIRYGATLMNNGGSIVNVSSIYSTHPEGKALPYSVSKAAVNALTLALAKETAPTIRINAVLPGNTLTSMVPNASRQREIEEMTLLKRSAQAGEIASVIAYLLSNESSYMTGELIYADGGYHIK